LPAAGAPLLLRMLAPLLVVLVVSSSTSGAEG
jgi:hypothetical protein